ncbi:serine/threonine-protein kinase 36 isoform X1 [Nerophis lumbriciformis]|uniref:serine/threonine-protein kinase 36 isoform X1 n=1 Tax=Nerophis lumbriciformis TaxID=546530 RepID=UPI002AE09E30|nr:serine/threonine-protein kinase 36-like isoform X1 [Nerophis lumbriciformis]
MDSYHVLELVGEGSFGRVHKGMKKFLGQVVALKFMPKMGRSKKELQSLKKEIDIMTNLQHPNIVKLFDSFETETEVVVVTEYAEGQLFQIIEDDGSLPESQVHEIACQLVSALYYLHSRRILHRDMKPQNILFDKNGVVKLCDFGFARAMSVSTMVLTSIKGTPLYMSPELVAEKPYDHTADLWSLGCILYELHTGAPPFYTNSIFHLVQLIVKDPIKWPDTMSNTCTSFLKGLLTKDPQMRLSWPDLLHHPFVADGVQVLPDTDVSSPLTVTPDPDMLALKLKQIAEKTPVKSGESKIVRKVKEQRSKSDPKTSVGSAKELKDGVESGKANSIVTSVGLRDKSFTPVYSTLKAPQISYQKNHTSGSSNRGLISQDYEREFPSVEVGPRQERRCDVTKNVSSFTTVKSEEFWERLVEESDLSRLEKDPFNCSNIVALLKSSILLFEKQLSGGVSEDVWRIRHPLKVLQNLMLTSDPNDNINQLGLPHLIISLVHNSVGNSHFIQQPGSLQALGEMIVVLLIYWQKNHDWLKEENRPEEFINPFLTILNQADLNPLAPLAGCVLSLFTQDKVAVNIDMDRLGFLLKELVCGSHQQELSLPPGWGLCDGLLSLLLHTLSEQSDGSSCLDPLVIHHVWEEIGTSLAKTMPDMDFCSTNGLHVLMSATMLVLCKDPYSYISLFCEGKSTFVYTLGWLLSTECHALFAEGCSGTSEGVLSPELFIELSCHFLCLPFALNLNSHTCSSVLHVYDSCDVVKRLLQVIETLPLSSVEVPLSLLRRLLLCDRQRCVSRLCKASCGFFSTPAVTTSGQQTPTRTASSLLCDLLLLDELGDSAVELLSLLYLITCFCPGQLHLEPSVLRRALAHAYDPIRAGTCKVLGKVFPFRSPTLPNLQPNIFKSMVDLLEDASVHVRRAACLAVGKWLGYVAMEAGFSTSRHSGNVGNTKKWVNVKGNDAHQDSSSEAGVAIVTKNESDDGEIRKWLEEARMTGARLASLTSDTDAHTRVHACAALGNLVHVNGAVPKLMEENVCRLLLRAACTDTHHAVREAATDTLSLYSQQDAIRQVLRPLDARKKTSPGFPASIKAK